MKGKEREGNLSGGQGSEEEYLNANASKKDSFQRRNGSFPIRAIV